MNHGNTHPKKSKLDNIVEQLNRRIAHLLGKRGKLPSRHKKTSNGGFVVLILIVSILLWGTTGFYYLGDKQFGLILANGKVTKVIKGLKVGLTYPYPFGNIEIMNSNVSDMLNLGLLNEGQDANYVALSSDFKLLDVDAKFAYQIIDPKALYINYLQSPSSLTNNLRFYLQQQMHTYLAKKTLNDILNANLTVMATEIRDNVNLGLNQYGVEIVKININKLSQLQLANKPESSTSLSKINIDIAKQALTPSIPIADELLNQADTYRQNTLAATKVSIVRFKQLLPQYIAHPNAIVDQMYYDLLASVPFNEESSYPLLNLSLPRVVALNSMEEDSSAQSATKIMPSASFRDVSRQVIRERNLNGSKQ